jgi:hypothetical protein
LLFPKISNLRPLAGSEEQQENECTERRRKRTEPEHSPNSQTTPITVLKKMSAITFDCYEEELNGLLDTVTQANDEATYSQAVRQAQDLLQQMTLEAQSCTTTDQDLKVELMARVRAGKTNLQARQQLQLEKEGLFRGATVPTALQNNEEQLAQQNERLEQSRRTLLEAEQVALGTVHELAQNRQKISSTQGLIKDLSQMTERADQLLKSMKRWLA